MTNATNKIGAVWARVSRETQESLDSQVARAKAKLEERGYPVPPERVIKVDWSSLDLFNCPPFQELRGWITRKEIGALGILDRDRLDAIGLQRLVFLSECKENSVELVICQGPPVLDELEGQLVELALSIGKQRQVLRAQEGSRDALRERATVKGLPTTCQAPYGYDWDESRTRLVANDKWEVRFLIVNLFLNDWTVKATIKELHERTKPSPTGKEWWVEPTIINILKDTVNFGEYRALRRESVPPKERRGNTYGKTSSRNLPGMPLPNIVVEKTVATREQCQWILARLEQNKMNAKRNGKRDYLLRGMIHYEGDNLRYYGTSIRGISWAYRYSPRGRWSDNPRPYLPGRRLEAMVEAKARQLLTSDEALEQEMGWREEALRESLARLEGEMRRLDRKSNENINAESELVSLRIRGKVSDDAYERQQNLLLAEKQWIAEERQRNSAKLAHLRQQSVLLVGLEELRKQMAGKLNSREFADRRFILEALGTRVIITSEGAIEIEFLLGDRKLNKDAIVTNLPLNACPRYSVVPLNPLLAVWLVGKSASFT